jgi:hypothetical protein
VLHVPMAVSIFLAGLRRSRSFDLACLRRAIFSLLAALSFCCMFLLCGAFLVLS